jgi:DNA (cytosine-5)-methyltransferase 1
MMGWPEGWVTDLVLPKADPRPDKLSRNNALRIIGNGVCPQQAVAAINWLLQIAAIEVA